VHNHAPEHEDTPRGNMQESLKQLQQRIDAREACVGVVGLGYVGLPVAVTFAEEGFAVIGVDVDDTKVETIQRGSSYLQDVPGERIRELWRAKRLSATTSFQRLSSADAILICLPTPVTDGAPDLSIIKEAVSVLSTVITPGTLIVLESTTYPGTTEELVQPILERSGLSAGQGYFLAYSPERIDPGNALYDFRDIPKVVGGVDSESGEAATHLYATVVPKVITVSGTREAELAKLIENTFRHVNIALVNELAVYANELGIDIWEAIDAAATKPFGFLPFRPGPGWGGHCIPLDPAYLSWRVRRDRAHEVRFVELAHAINSEMSRYVVERASLLLNEQGKSVRNAHLLCIGAAYKGGTQDTRESPALKIIHQLLQRGANVSYHDPLVPTLRIEARDLVSRPLSPAFIREQDLVVVLIPQERIPWEALLEHARAVLDCCNALRTKREKVRRL
jgi:UDP-N-acetyl-D-glucosamine dehydrogenase